MIAKRTFPPGELARTPANTVATKPMDAHFLFAFTQTQNSLRFCTEASRGPILSAPKNLSGFLLIKFTSVRCDKEPYRLDPFIRKGLLPMRWSF